MKEFFMAHKKQAMIGAAIVAAVMGAITVIAIAQSPRQELATNEAVNFEDSSIAFHSAEDGIAVVRPVPATQPKSQKTTDPDTIWVGDDAATYNNFTLPMAVQMDDESIGVLNIPDIGLSVRVYESSHQMEDMEKGVAHFKSTSAWDGTVGLSAHNVNLNGTDGYFKSLYTLKKGAALQYTTALGTREYVVESITEIAETDWSKLGRTEDNRLTMITCITGKPTMRLCVTASEKPPQI